MNLVIWIFQTFLAAAYKQRLSAMIKLIHSNPHFKCVDNSCIIIKDQSS